jgi:hypothetical protein
MAITQGNHIMSRIVTTLFLAASLIYACGKTAKIVKEAPGVVLPEIPTEKPTTPIPPIKAPNDDVLQNDEVEADALEDAFSLNSADVQNTGYISAADFYNYQDDLKVAMRGTNLGFNLLSNRSFIESVRPVGDKGAVFAVDLRDFWGSRGNINWKLIEDENVFPIVSQTARFRNLQFLTQKRLPIMHAKIFFETAFKASVYYRIKDVPQLENDFWKQQGIDRQKQFDDRDRGIFLAGFQESLIAPDHNRLVRRMEGINGPCWNTYDVDALQIIDQSNFFKFPFPPEARSKKTLIHNAGEILCRSPNGLWTAALYNAAGLRQDEAPPTVVVNTRTGALGLDVQIRLRDCAGCHTQFVLPVRDELRRQIADNPFDAPDKLLALNFFKPQSQLDSIILQDNSAEASALAQINIQQGGADPLNVGMIDKMRDGFTAKELAAFLYLSEGEFLQRLAGSQAASQEFGGLLQGGTTGFLSLQSGRQVLLDDLNLFRDLN